MRTSKMIQSKREELDRMCITGQWITVPVVPLGKPRMTRADAWKRRECVQSYWNFKDELRLRLGRSSVSIPHLIKGVSWFAYFPIPKSWSKKKASEMAGTIHQVKPDRDNIDKAILDSLFGDDSGVAIGLTGKFWDDGEGARIEILFIT